MASPTPFLLFVLLVAVTAQHARGRPVRVIISGENFRCPENSRSDVSTSLVGAPLVNANVTLMVKILDQLLTGNAATGSDGSFTRILLSDIPFVVITPFNLTGVAVVALKENTCDLPGPGVIATPLVLADDNPNITANIRVVTGPLLYVGGSHFTLEGGKASSFSL